jgi:hypothetical protein
MAVNHINKKLQTYHSLFQINRAFTAIARHCRILEEAEFLPAAKMRVFRGLIREMQSQLSHDITDKMHEVEGADMFRFGKIRIAWEHYLNPKRPPFNSHQ